MGVKAVLPVIIVFCMGCGGGAHDGESLFGRMEPKDASEIAAFLDRHHEPYTLQTEDGAMMVLVAPDRAKLLKAYLSGPVDSVGYVNLVKGCRLAEKDSARVRREPSPPKRKFTYLLGGRSDSTRIGEAFDSVFTDGRWKALRTREKEIVVEFTGTVKEHVLENSFGMKVMGELTGHRGYLASEVGAPGAIWSFRWRIGIEGKSIVRENTRVTLGGKREGNARGGGEVLHIDL